jgi:HK97 family phage major capsid protein
MNAKIRALQAKKAEHVDAMRAMSDKLAAEARDFTADEQAQFDAHMEAAQAAQRSIDREHAVAALESGLQRPAPATGASTPTAPPPAGGVVIPANAEIRVSENVENDPKRGFKSQGDFFQAVRGAALAVHGNGRVDPRLTVQAAAPGSTTMSESNGADGSFAIPPEFSQEIWKLSIEGEQALLPLTKNTEIGTNSMSFPKDETAPWDPSGVTAYWRGEAASATPTKPVYGLDTLRLKELMVFVPVTNELLEDAPALGGYLTDLAADRILWKTNEAILFGGGGQQPLGCMNSNSGPLIVCPKETGQATSTLVQANISRMRSRLKTGELKNAVWVGNPDILPALEGMTVGQLPIFLPPGQGIHAGFDGTLNGRPLILSEHANTLGQQSDISLLALSGYRTITKAGGIESATSMHLYFDANATAFRFIFRIDGQPITKAPIPAPAGKGSQTRSYFVTLAARP